MFLTDKEKRQIFDLNEKECNIINSLRIRLHHLHFIG